MTRRATRSLCFVAVFCILAVLSVGLRFHGLDAQGLWSDELFSASVITQVGEGRPWYDYVPTLFPDLRIGDSALTWKAGENSPPLFEVLLWLWTGVFGLSDFSVRALSAMAGTLAPLVLFVGLRRPLGLWAAGGAALIFVLSPSAVAYAQEARGYALLMLLATCAVVRLVHYGVLDERDRPHFGLDVVLYVLLSYTHYTGLVLACGLVTVRFVLAYGQGRPLREFGYFVWVPLLLAPWLYLNWFSMAQTGTGRFGWRDYGWPDVWDLMLPKATAYFMPGVYAGFHILWVLLGLASAAAAWSQWKKARQPASAGVDTRWLLVVGFAGMVTVHFCYGIYTAFHARVWHERYFSAMLPVGMALFALLFSLAGRRHYLPRILSCVVVLAGCAASLPGLKAYYQKPWKEEYREASLYIVQKTRGQPTVVATWASNAIYFNYYLRSFMSDAGRTYTLETVGQEGNLEAGVKSLCQRPWRKGEQVVLFQHQMHRLYFDLVNRDCAGVLTMVSERQFRGLYVNFYEATGASPPFR